MPPVSSDICYSNRIEDLTGARSSGSSRRKMKSSPQMSREPLTHVENDLYFGARRGLLLKVPPSSVSRISL